MKTPDKKALVLLSKLIHNQIFLDDSIPLEEMEYLRLHGLLFETKQMSHDEVIAWLFDEYRKCDKKEITDNFLVGVGQNQPQLRAALSAYAIMTKFPEHGYQTNTGNECCICALYRNNEVDLTLSNSMRYDCGAVIGNADEMAFFLNRHNVEDHLHAVSEDIILFSKIITLIANSPYDEKPVTLYKKIRKIPGVKMSVEEARCFLDLLGHAGILQTKKHLGFIYRAFCKTLFPEAVIGANHLHWDMIFQICASCRGDLMIFMLIASYFFPAGQGFPTRAGICGDFRVECGECGVVQQSRRIN